MSNETNESLSRRSFLKTATVMTGGLTIAVYLPGCSKSEQASEAAANTGPVPASSCLK